MDFLQEKIGFEPFPVPEDHAGLNVLFWPTVDEQIKFIAKELQTLESIIDKCVYNNELYQEYVDRQVQLTAVLHTLEQVKKLRTGQRD